jgi:hypothetical protein
MGTMTGAQLEAEIKANLGNRTDLDSRLYTFLNWAQIEIARKLYLRELETITASFSTVADQDYIAQPGFLRDLISFRLMDGTSSRKLTWIPRRVYDDWCPSPSSVTTARSTHFTAWAGVFYLWRIPDAAYATKMIHTNWPTPFTAASTSASDIDELDELIVILATVKAFRSLKDIEAKIIITYKNDAKAIMRDAKAYDKGLHVDEEVKAYYTANASGGDYWTNPFIQASP